LDAKDKLSLPFNFGGIEFNKSLRKSCLSKARAIIFPSDLLVLFLQEVIVNKKANDTIAYIVCNLNIG
jgi:hypothetical protein